MLFVYLRTYKSVLLDAYNRLREEKITEMKVKYKEKGSWNFRKLVLVIPQDEEPENRMSEGSTAEGYIDAL